MSSLIKKYWMAITGFVLVCFVFVHMLGNLQMFISPERMNSYAHALQHLPYGLLWGFRFFLLLAVVIHVTLAIALTKENRRARLGGASQTKAVKARWPSRTMGISGSILAFFIVFHLLHFTTRSLFPEYKTFFTMVDGKLVYDFGKPVYNVYHMVVSGFSKEWVAIFYIVSMKFLCAHLSHGVSSMFQSLGFRNRKWKQPLDLFARIYGWALFLGFISVPVAVLVNKYLNINFLPV